MEQQIKALTATIESNKVSLRDAQEALDHHLNQLSRLGATLEDDVCGVLRKVIAQAQARQELEAIREKLSAELNALCPF